MNNIFYFKFLNLKSLTNFSAIIKIQKQIDTHDDNIKDIEVTHPIETGSYFVRNTKYITGNYNPHKNRTFPFYHFGSQTFDDGYRPPKRKT